MDNSTEGVTLLAGYLADVVETVKEAGHDTDGIQSIIQDYPLDNPYKQIPMEVYNAACDWVEQELGDGVIEIGKKIGARAFDILTNNHIITEDADVSEIIEGLEIAASTTIQDPKERGWEILESQLGRIVMRRTQTFNSRLQFGLLEGLVKRCKTVDPESISIQYLNEVAQGAEFDDYEITWRYQL